MSAHRRGFSLVEALVVIGVSAGLLTLCGELLQRVMRAQVQSHREWEITREFQRLANALREDAWSALEVTLDADTVKLKCEETRVVTYDIEGHCIERRVWANEGTSSELYTFPPATALHWVQPSAAELQLWLTLPTNRLTWIGAYIGRDHRFRTQTVSESANSGGAHATAD